MMNNHKDLLKTLVDLLDGIVEVFLVASIRPVLDFHARADHAVDQILRKTLQDHKDKAPKWILKADFLTYTRLALAMPTTILLSWGTWFLPALLVVVVHFASFFERILAEHNVEHGNDDSGEDSMHAQTEDGSFGKSKFP